MRRSLKASVRRSACCNSCTQLQVPLKFANLRKLVFLAKSCRLRRSFRSGQPTNLISLEVSNDSAGYLNSTFAGTSSSNHFILSLLAPKLPVSFRNLQHEWRVQLLRIGTCQPGLRKNWHSPHEWQDFCVDDWHATCLSRSTSKIRSSKSGMCLSSTSNRYAAASASENLGKDPAFRPWLARKSIVNDFVL